MNRASLQHSRSHDCVAQSTWHSLSAHCICNLVRAPTPGHLQFCTGTTAPSGWPSPLSTGAASSRPSRHESTCAPAPTHPQLRHRQLAPATLCQAALANAAPMWPFFFCTLGPDQSCACAGLQAPRSWSSNTSCRCSVHSDYARWIGQRSHGTC